MKIAIDLGHGVQYDGGAVGPKMNEEEIINSIGRLVIDKLKSLCHEVVEVRPTTAVSTSNSLIQRVTKANRANVDLFLSIHANAGGGRGCEAYTFQGVRHKEATNILSNLQDLGFINRGVKCANYFVVNQTVAKAILLEVCFIDSIVPPNDNIKTDVELYQSIGAEKIANAIVNGLTGEVVVDTKYTPVDETLKHWQQAYNWTYGKCIAVDNIYGSETSNAIDNTLIKEGMTNSLVGFIQCRVGVEVDNMFGPNTKKAVIKWQQNNGLVADGIFGPKSFRKMLGV